MELGLIAFNQIISMFIIILIGIICFKTKLIDKKTNSALSAIVLNIVNPALIFNSYQIDFDKDLAVGLAYAVLLSAITYLIAIPLSSLIFRKKNTDYKVERMSCIYSNCGFIGIPLVSAVVGQQGVFYISVCVTVFNVMLWTHGVMLMSGKTNIKNIAKSLVSPCLISVILGLICFFAGIKLPTNVYNAFGFVADMNTPMAMLVAGVTIAQTNVLQMIRKLRFYFISLIKLIVIPVIVVLVFYLFKNIVDYDIVITAVIAAACPTGASTTMFAIRYKENELYASEIFGITTLISVITLPLIISFAEFILY